MKAILLLVVAISYLAHAMESGSVDIADAGRATPDVTQAICAHNEGCTPCERLNTLDIRLPLTHTNLVPGFSGAKSFSLGVTTPWPVATTEFERDGVKYTTGRCAYNIISHGYAAADVLKTDVRSVLLLSHLFPKAPADSFPQVVIDLNVTNKACAVDEEGAGDRRPMMQFSSQDALAQHVHVFGQALEAPTERAYYLHQDGAVCADLTFTVPTEQLNTAYYRLGLDVFSVATRLYELTNEEARRRTNYLTSQRISEETLLTLVGLLVAALAGAVYGCCKYRAARIAEENKIAGYGVISDTKTAEKPATVGEGGQVPATAAMLVAEVEAPSGAQE